MGSISLKDYPFFDVTEANRYFSKKIGKFLIFQKIREKFTNLLQKLMILIKTFYIENNPTGTCRSMIRRMGEYQKAHLALNFHNVASLYNSKKTRLSSFISASITALHLYKSTPSKIRGFVPCVTILLVRKVLPLLI